MRHRFTVRYRGFLQTVERTFPTRARAEQWRAQVGRKDAIITKQALPKE